MKDLVYAAVKDANDFTLVLNRVIEILWQSKRKGVQRIGYVAGLVSSDGQEKIQENLERLNFYTNLLSKKYPKAKFFSAADIFNEDLYKRLLGDNFVISKRKKSFLEFWRGILREETVDDVSMTPGWDRSVGAIDEHKTILKLGLKHQYVEYKSELLIKKCCK